MSQRSHAGRWIPAFLLAFTVAGCGDSTGPGGAPCTGSVDVTVSSGTTPTISWTPNCRLWLVGVEADDGDVWVIASPGRNGISPGVRYGVVPRGAMSDGPAVPLIAGQTYNVFVGRHTGPDDDDGVLAGVRTFTP